MMVRRRVFHHHHHHAVALILFIFQHISKDDWGVTVVAIAIAAAATQKVPTIQAQPQLEQRRRPQHCGPDRGGGFCPMKNTCCLLPPSQDDDDDDDDDDDSTTSFFYPLDSSSSSLSSSSKSSSSFSSSSGCVPSDLGAYHATCCTDEVVIGTACGVGYTCENTRTTTRTTTPVPILLQQRHVIVEQPQQFFHRNNNNNDNRAATTNTTNDDRYYYCQASTAILDPLVQRLPRYRLCTANHLLQTVYGLPVHKTPPSTTTTTSSHNNNKNKEDKGMGLLAYYSTHGDLLAATTTTTKVAGGTSQQQMKQQQMKQQHSDLSQVKIAIVIIHGSRRNADDYFCAMTAAAEAVAAQQEHKHQYTKQRSLLLSSSSILVVAPWFLQVGDDDDAITGLHSNKNSKNHTTFLQWSNHSHDGSWRYGADAVLGLSTDRKNATTMTTSSTTSSNSNTGISSYDCVDAIIQLFLSSLSDDDDDNDDDKDGMILQRRFPALERIVVAGHSSGGQFVQRWSLLTKQWPTTTRTTTRATTTRTTTSRTRAREARLGPVAKDEPSALRKNTWRTRYYNNNNNNTNNINNKNKNNNRDDSPSVRLHALVANPSSYAYLIPERYIQGKWKIPSWNNSSYNNDCPGYNQWQWGLELPPPPIRFTNNNTSNKNTNDNDRSQYRVRYLVQTLQEFDYDYKALKQRFAQRHVGYLIGSQDRCNVSSSEERPLPWCHSHGLETTCADQLQGHTRMERHVRYYQSLWQSFSLFDNNKNNIITQRNDTALRRRRPHRHWAVTIPGVGHDHSLMFNSPRGLYELFVRI